MKPVFDAVQFGVSCATPIIVVLGYAWLRKEIRALRLPPELQDDEADPVKVQEAAESWRRETL